MDNFSAYLDQRLTALGITDSLNTWVTEKDGKPVPEWTYKFFSADTETGNINIQYISLTGQPYHWKSENNKWPKPFVRTRLRVETKDQKYSQPKGSGQFPFFPPSTIKKFQAKEKIETLLIVEGEFKAFKACMHGFDAVGIPSIHGFYNGDVRGKLHEDIQEVLLVCQVRNVVYLTDADTLTVKWEDGKDLAKRPQSFISAVKYFRESLQQLLDDDRNELKNVFFMHILPRYMNEGKGMDDLLCYYSAAVDEIREDVMQFQFARKYFVGFMLNDYNSSLTRLKKHFGLTDEKEFYETYRAFIGDREFNFNRRRYQWDSENKEVTFVKHEDAVKFMRIGADYLKIIQVPNKYGEVESEIIPFKKTEIIQDYGKGFIEEITKYDNFVVDPSWNGEYRRTVSGCYNLMEPLKWHPAAGEFPVTYKFLKHIFGGSATLDENIEGDTFSVALDYLTIMYREPKHMLPVPILVSKENETGKSTFLKWLQGIYGANMCVLNNEQFKSKFNSHYITKFIISIDEGFLDVDKKSEKERLKQLVTADTFYLELKGINMKKIQYYGKLILCSNDEDRIMKIDSEETRWFVVKVPVLAEKDPDIEKKLYAEIPAWLNYLQQRQIFHPRKTRLWFTPENIITEQFRVVVETTKNRVDRVFEDWIREQFFTFRMPVLRYPIKYLTEVFNDPRNSKYRIDAIELGEFLKKRLNMHPEKLTRIDIPIGYNAESAFQEINYHKVVARPYVFRAENWLSAAELAEWPADEQKETGKETEGTEKRKSVETEIDFGKGYPKNWG
jgi:hypothetical protein